MGMLLTDISQIKPTFLDIAPYGIAPTIITQTQGRQMRPDFDSDEHTEIDSAFALNDATPSAVCGHFASMCMKEHLRSTGVHRSMNTPKQPRPGGSKRHLITDILEIVLLAPI